MTHAHVTTHRLGSSEETEREMAYAEREGVAVNDQAARTIASWWHSPAPRSAPILALSQGRPFDTDDLRDAIGREVTDPTDSGALLTWLDALEAHLTE